MGLSNKSKENKLKATDMFNKKAEEVSDPLFQSLDFFDANDLMQVKYEMLRRVAIEKWSATQAASCFGFSRVSFYNIQSSFEQEGLAGLIPKKTGPKSAHKLTDDIMEYIQKSLEKDASLNATNLVKKIENKFSLTIHKRSIERALSRSKKKLKQI